jgi:hypothetical protein
MGGSTTPWTVPQMDYRGFNLATMIPNSSGVSEPESAGTIGWLLYHAWLKTGNKKYLEGAQMAIVFLSGLSFNPAYEIQLPYGSFVAAKMNAELGTHYNIEKMVNWSFDQSSKRNWGTIVGSWGDAGNINVSGLVGEVDNPATGYAFAMNGFEQAAALVPLVKYDKRFARAIAKWTLNLANASRLFYPAYLPPANQDNLTWSSTYDPHSVIPYEALKQTSNGKHLYGTGDAMRNAWAQTNLGLYGASHVGYLAAIVERTDVDGILLLDVNKTDFFGQNAFSSFIVYNPYAVVKQVTLPLGGQVYDIYDAITQTMIKTSATGNTPINVPADAAMLLVYLPGNSTPVASDGKLYLGNRVVDYHYGYDFAGKFRIKSLAPSDTLVEFNRLVPIYSSLENAPGPVTYNWYANGVLLSSSSSSAFSFTSPQVAGMYSLRLKVVSGVVSAQDSIQVHVVAHIPVAPVITGFKLDSAWHYTSRVATLICLASNAAKGVYKWTLPGGSVLSQKDSLINWTLPGNEGLYEIACEVTNSDGLKASGKKQVLVKARSSGTTGPFAYYPLDGNVLDYSGNGHNAVLQGATPTADARGEPNKAYHFSSDADIIYVPNDASLNFQDKITLGFWVKLDAVPQETYVLSHGSYEERWKVSIVPNGKLRWTVKTTLSTTDLDTTFPLDLNRFYHFTTVYTGYSVEVYADGLLDAYLAATGPLSTTTKAITFGKKDASTSNYYLRGTLDEVRIYDNALAPNEIATLKTLWNTITSVRNEPEQGITVYPNPATTILFVKGLQQASMNVELIDVTGRKIAGVHSYGEDKNLLIVEFDKMVKGLVILRIETTEGIVYRKVLVDP